MKPVCSKNSKKNDDQIASSLALLAMTERGSSRCEPLLLGNLDFSNPVAAFHTKTMTEDNIITPC